MATISQRWLCSALLSLGVLRSGAALPFTFGAWTTREGLPENRVTCLTQTPDGYLWLGTEDGLARFDGVRFVTYSLRDGLRSTRIWTLFAAHDGTLWAGTFGGGLSRRRGEHFETFGPEAGLPSGSVRAIAEDASGRLWVGSTRGLVLWQDGRFRQPEVPAELRGKAVVSLLCDRQGAVWLGIFQEGLWRFQDGKFLRDSSPTTPPEVLGTCEKLWEDKDGRLWVCVDGDNLFCRETNRWQGFPIPRGSSLGTLRSLAEEADGTMWAGSVHNGIFFVQHGQLGRLTVADGLSENAIDSLFVDREQNLWVGTIGGGLDRMRRKTVRAFGRSEGLGYPVVRALAEVAPGELWVGTQGDGLFRWQNGRFTRLETDEGFSTNFYFVNSLVVARDGSCWVGTGLGLHRFVHSRRESHPDWLAAFKSDSVLALCEDRREGMWVGAANRLWLVKSGRLELQTNVVPTRPILSLAQDRTGALWVGTEGDGLYQIRAGQVKCFTQADGLGSDQVRALHLDAADNLWIGTTGGGLSRLTAGRIVTLTTSRGLPADTIAQILEDDAGYLWLGTYRGIARVSKSQFEDVVSGRTQSLSPRVLGLSDGMPSEECTGGYSPAGLKLSSGELCFATLKGIVMVDPPRAWPITPPPPVRLEELLIDGVAQNPSSSPQAPNGHKLEPLDANRSPSSASSSADRQLLFVAPGRHQFEFHYTGLNFGAPERIRFRYQLEGLDPGWVEAGTRRTAFYTDVPPGNYRFQVIACNNDGVWSQTGAAIGLEIQPFLWQRWWFIAVAGLAALALAAGLSRLFERRRHQRELTRLAALHVVERERTRIAKDIHDDLGATLSAIRLLSKFAQAPEMPAERLREDMRQIAAKALESTQALDEIVWAVDPQSDSLEGFVNYACAFATEQLALADVRCRLDLPANIPAKTLQADVRHNLFLAFKEVITNVLKHAAATEVHVSMEINPQALAIAVTDNGRGLPADDSRMASGAGLATRRHGLPNLRSRLRQIGGDCEMESLPGRGVTARLRIPL